MEFSKDELNSALKNVLKDCFGHSEFRGVQRSVIECILSRKSLLVVMPTGTGKSLCYQMPTEFVSGLVVVISPLIALMKDQVDAAQKKGLDCCFINSSLDMKERESRYRKLKEGRYKLIYVTPERFRKEEFLEALSAREISILAVDEAHCISMWGHDFRPDYSRLGEIRKLLKNPPTMALTATATGQVQGDILKQLEFDEGEVQVFVSGFERPNLSFEVSSVCGWDEKIRCLIGLRHMYSGPAIVYFSLISSLEKVSHELSRLGVDHFIYHGQQPEAQRKKSQERFFRSDQALMLATPAFGLGVDKPDVRLVVHGEIPSSVEAYYQEAGRAGRDGDPSHCHLLYDGDDIAIQMAFIKWASPEPGFIYSLYRLLQNQPDKVAAGGLDYLREQMNFYNRGDFRVETAMNLLERWDCIRKVEEKPLRYETLCDPPEDLLSEELHKNKMDIQNRKLLEMVEYTRLETCRQKYIYEYFGQKGTNCGICDNCKRAE